VLKDVVVERRKTRNVNTTENPLLTEDLVDETPGTRDHFQNIVEFLLNILVF